jgi:hypothetical protein
LNTYSALWEKARAGNQLFLENQTLQKLQRSQYGRRAERLDDDQLQFAFEDLDADIARAEATLPSAKAIRRGSDVDRSTKRAGASVSRGPATRSRASVLLLLRRRCGRAHAQHERSIDDMARRRTQIHIDVSEG